jgi:hypothetical protein
MTSTFSVATEAHSVGFGVKVYTAPVTGNETSITAGIQVPCTPAMSAGRLVMDVVFWHNGAIAGGVKLVGKSMVKQSSSKRL